MGIESKKPFISHAFTPSDATEVDEDEAAGVFSPMCGNTSETRSMIR